MPTLTAWRRAELLVGVFAHFWHNPTTIVVDMSRRTKTSPSIIQRELENNAREIRLHAAELLGCEELKLEFLFAYIRQFNQVGGSINRIRDLFLFRLRPLFSEREIIRLIEETEEEIKRRLLEQRHPEKALNEEREAMMMRLRAVIMNAPSHPTKLVPAEISRARDGHESILIPCPQCGKPKRVFPEQTKRFRCDCGFDRPYPFS